MCLCSRYTSHLLTNAAHVTAVDFMESFVERNRQDNGHHSNVTFIQADVTKLDVPKNRCVFSYLELTHSQTTDFESCCISSLMDPSLRFNLKYLTNYWMGCTLAATSG